MGYLKVLEGAGMLCTARYWEGWYYKILAKSMLQDTG